MLRASRVKRESCGLLRLLKSVEKSKPAPLNNPQGLRHTQEPKPQRVDWIRTKAPVVAAYASDWRTEAIRSKGAFDDAYWM